MMLWFCVVAASLGGFLLGYHTAVIAGALLFIKNEFQLMDSMQGMVVSIILLGSLVSAIFAGVAADRFGRRNLFFLASVTIILGTFIATQATSSSLLLAGRFITGIGIGFISVVTPMYLGEISTVKHRGTIISFYQIATTFGVLIAFLVNYILGVDEDWRGMIAWGMLPAGVLIACLPFMVESPDWFLERGFLEKSRRAFARLGLPRKTSPLSETKEGSWSLLFAPKYRLSVFVGLALASLQQFTGIGIVIYYAPQIFNMVGLPSSDSSILATVGLGIMQLVATCIAAWLLDRLGRKLLLLIGLSGMGLSLCSIALAFIFQFSGIGSLSIIALILYIAFYSLSMGPVTWVLVAEIYPVAIRGRAMSFATLGNWLSNYLCALGFLPIAAVLGIDGTFLLLTLICFLTFFFVFRFLPETKGKSVHEIVQLFGHQKS